MYYLSEAGVVGGAFHCNEMSPHLQHTTACHLLPLGGDGDRDGGGLGGRPGGGMGGLGGGGGMLGGVGGDGDGGGGGGEGGLGFPACWTTSVTPGT